MLIGNLYLIRTRCVQDELLEAEMLKSMEIILPEYSKTKVACLELEDKELFIPFLPENEANQLIHTFKTLGILIDVLNVTELILKRQALTPELSSLFSDPKYDLLRNQFISANLTKDIVLDKISSMGIGSLTDLDHQILNS